MLQNSKLFIMDHNTDNKVQTKYIIYNKISTPMQTATI